MVVVAYLGFLLILASQVGSKKEIVTENDVYSFRDLSTDDIYPSDDAITFDVKACSDATVGLMSEQGTLLYEFVIGGHSNTRNYIRRPNFGVFHEVDDRNHPGLLSCSVFKKFWVTWKLGEMKFGQGGDKSNQTSTVAYWIDQNPVSVSSVAIRTGYGSVGTWIFSTTCANSTEEYANKTTFTDSFRVKLGNRAVGEKIREYIDKSKLECGMLCSMEPNCVSFNKQYVTFLCELFRSGAMVSFDNEWQFWEMSPSGCR